MRSIYPVIEGSFGLLNINNCSNLLRNIIERYFMKR